MYFILIMGPAGSGKSTLTAAFSQWIEDHQMSVAKVNLDPAAEVLPYVPDVDVRRYVKTYDIMIKEGLGPNGALVASVDLLINHIAELVEEIYETRSNYVIVDMPGQLEIVAFRRIGPQLIKELTKGSKVVSLFLTDARLVAQPASAFSILLLMLSSLYRMDIPLVPVVNKVDLVASKETLEKDPTVLEDNIYLLRMLRDDYSCLDVGALSYYIDSDVSAGLCRILKQAVGDVVPVSAKEFYGLDELYAKVQQILAGGEDYLTEEPSGVL
ncbi:MAG: ATP/GTP-binding protein [Desulfurococcales archaeon]|nr:ATP/GTP-binding protein [Desulfurococcales archaeon]